MVALLIFTCPKYAKKDSKMDFQNHTSARHVPSWKPCFFKPDNPPHSNKFWTCFESRAISGTLQNKMLFSRAMFRWSARKLWTFVRSSSTASIGTHFTDVWPSTLIFSDGFGCYINQIKENKNIYEMNYQSRWAILIYRFYKHIR